VLAPKQRAYETCLSAGSTAMLVHGHQNGNPSGIAKFLLTRNTVSFTVIILMKKEIIYLAETTHDALVSYAKADGVGLPQLCSVILTEFADKHRQNGSSEQIARPLSTRAGDLPDTVQQVLAICSYVWRDRAEFNEAINRTATEFSVQSTTVRDKCTRRISIPGAPVDTSRFRTLLSDPSALRHHLCRKFPKHEAGIIKGFNSLPVGSATPAPSGPDRATKPRPEFKEKQLVEGIIAVLKENEGAAPKSVVEESVFQMFRAAFENPFYQELVGAQVGFAGVPRWRKNIEFARNTAREMGLIKPPGESGRGIWELSELGKGWSAS
jgi:hypothetical protein